MRKFLAATLTFTLLFAPLAALAQQDPEVQIGQQVYQELSQKGEIIRDSPYYAILNPIAERISRVASPQYGYPFHFILVHEKNPNAFAVPGGNVYVTDSMMTFAQNREELAGVLCHETAHDIHHDVMNLNRKAQNVNIAANVLSLLIGGGKSQIANLIIGSAAQLQDLHFSRDVEESADLKGAQTCAQAGFNPWGMVWLFKNFEKADTGGHAEFLSDHPNDEHRIARLEELFASQPSLYGRFSSNIANATPLRRV